MSEFKSVIDELKSLREQNLSVDLELIETIDHVLKFEYLISGISAKFSNLEPSQIEKEIENGLRLIVEFFQLDRSTFFEISGNKDQFISKYSFARNNVKPIKTKIGNKLFPWTFATLKAGNIIWFASHLELPNEAKHDANNFLKSNLLAGYIVPIFINNKIKYALAGGLKNIKQEKWPESLFPRIQILGEIFANAVERSRYEIQLKESIKLCSIFKKELEFENFYLRKKQKPDDDLRQISKSLKYDKSVMWISKGIEYYAENRNLKLNNICKTIGLSKTSFYNIYPNSETSNGFDRYKHDFIDFFDYKLTTIFDQIKDATDRYSCNDLKKIFIEICYQNYTYLKCLALMVIEKEESELIIVGQKIHKEFQKVLAYYLKKVTNTKDQSGKKLTNMQNALINTIYHQSLVAKAMDWRQSIIEILDGYCTELVQ